MRMTFSLATLLLIAPGAVRAQDGLKPLFNGKDLKGWHNVNCAPNTFFVKDDMLITTGKPMGYLRTDKQYENFIAEFEWMHIPPKKGEVGNSGFFVWCDPLPTVGSPFTRGIEVQVLVNLEWTDKKSGKSTATSHGDLFCMTGATCEPDRPHPLGWKRSIPSENRAKGENEWNHYRIEANDGTIKLAVNGKFVSMVTKCNPRKGYLALEAEGSECRFKNLKIKELPSTNPKKEEIAEVDKGWKRMLTGLDVSGWEVAAEQLPHWKIRDGVLVFDGKDKSKLPIKSKQAFGDFELVCDWRLPVGSTGEPSIGYRNDPGILILNQKAGVWHRSILRVQDDDVRMSVDNVDVLKKTSKLPRTGPISLGVSIGEPGPVEFRNVFIRELKEK